VQSALRASRISDGDAVADANHAPPAHLTRSISISIGRLMDAGKLVPGSGNQLATGDRLPVLRDAFPLHVAARLNAIQKNILWTDVETDIDCKYGVDITAFSASSTITISTKINWKSWKWKYGLKSLKIICHLWIGNTIVWSSRQNEAILWN